MNLDVLANCWCHTWVLRAPAINGYGRCRRCGTRPRIIGEPRDPQQATICRHDGPCRP